MQSKSGTKRKREEVLSALRAALLQKDVGVIAPEQGPDRVRTR